MQFQVKLLSDAKADFERQFDYLWQRSPSGANAWAEAFDEAVAELKQTADSFGMAPESVDHLFDVHQLTFKTKQGNRYRLLYEIVGSEVFVMTVRGLGQDRFGQD